jgi:hypothetical protein
MPSSAGTGSFSPTTPTVIPEFRMSLPRPPDPKVDPASYLRDIHAVRERCSIVLKEALVNKLSHFDVDMDKFPDVAHYVVSIIKVRMTFISPSNVVPEKKKKKIFFLVVGCALADMSTLTARFRTGLLCYPSPRPLAAL